MPLEVGDKGDEGGSWRAGKGPPHAHPTPLSPRCSYSEGAFRLTAGVGVNVANEAAPFASLSTLARTAAAPRAPDRAALLAAMLNRLEPMLDALCATGWAGATADAYHAAWLHSGQAVTVADDSDGASPPSASRLVIERVSDAGFLQAVDGEGRRVELHPDASSLDLLAGLVRRKA